MRIEISDETVKWVKLAIKDFDPLTAPAGTPSAIWACYAINNAIERDELALASLDADGRGCGPHCGRERDGE